MQIHQCWILAEAMKIQVATTFVAHEFLDFNEPQLLSDEFLLHLPKAWRPCLSMMPATTRTPPSSLSASTTSVTKGMKGCNSFNVTCQLGKVANMFFVADSLQFTPPENKRMSPNK